VVLVLLCRGLLLFVYPRVLSNPFLFMVAEGGATGRADGIHIHDDQPQTFRIWKARTNAMLALKNVGDYTSGAAVYDKGGARYDAEKAKKCMGLITLSLGPIALEKVILSFPDLDDPAGAWRTVCGLFEGTDRATRRALRQQLHTDRMAEDESVTAYMNRKKATVSRLKAAGDTISDEQLQDYILSGLTSKYEHIVIQHMFTDILLAKTEDLLREYDQLLRNSITPALEGDAYVNTDANAYMSRAEKLKKHRTCHNCGKYGHYKSECRAPGGGAATSDVDNAKFVRIRDPDAIYM